MTARCALYECLSCLFIESTIVKLNRVFSYPPLVSPKCPHAPLRAGGWPLWATKSEGVGLIVRAISFQDFQPMWPGPPTSQTDRQTDRRKDGRTTCNRNTALCTSASRGKNTHENLCSPKKNDKQKDN